MKQHVKSLLGMNAASISQLVRAGPSAFWRSSRQAFTTANHPESPALDSIPRITLDEILGDRRVRISLRVSAYEDGMLPVEQSMVLLSILMAARPEIFLEIGTYMGHTTRNVAENLPWVLVHTVDLPEDFNPDLDQSSAIEKDDFHLIRRRIVGREFEDLIFKDQITQHFQDTATWDFSGVGSPAAFFIDGSHTYEYVKNDSEKCLAIAAPGATFLWHDCDDGHPGILRFVHEWRALGREIRLIERTPLAYWKAP